MKKAHTTVSLIAAALLSAIFLSTAVVAFAKDTPPEVIVWPASGTPVLRFTFSKFKKVNSIGNQRTYRTDTTAENLSPKTIAQAHFVLYLFDDSKARIGQGLITVNDLSPGQTVKSATSVLAYGIPAHVELASSYLSPDLRPPEPTPATPPRSISISITINSVPQGASVKLDGVEVGTTPKIVRVVPGSHKLEFSKEGYNSGTFPLEIGPDDASGGSVSYELGTSAHDTIELRDGSVLNGDLESVSGMDVVVRIGGTPQHFNRNQVKRILLTERDTPAVAQ